MAKTWTVDLDPGCIFGEGSRFLTGKKLKELGATTVMLITDATMKQLGYTDEMEQIIREEGLTVVPYQAETREPTSTMCNVARDFAVEHKIDGIVALGGGAVMDIAKAAGKLLANGGMLEEYLGYEKANIPYKRWSPIICLSTTAGTGAEINNGISIFNDAIQKKGNTKHPATLAITDPYYTYGSPKKLTACVGVDALAHAAETLCNSEYIQNWMSDCLAKEAVSIIFKALPGAYNDDHECRDKMAFAAELAGWSIKLRKTTFGHALGHRFANRYHWAHGICCGICLPAVVRYHAKMDAGVTMTYAHCIGIDCREKSYDQIAAEVVKAFDDLLHAVDMPSMKSLGVEPAFIDEICEDIRSDPKWTLVPHPPVFEEVAVAMHEAYEQY